MKNRLNGFTSKQKKEDGDKPLNMLKDFSVKQENNKKYFVLSGAMVITVLVVWLFFINQPEELVIYEEANNPETLDFDIMTSPANGRPLADVIGLYEEYDQKEVVYLYLTLYQGENGSGDLWDFADVNRYTRKISPDPWVEVHVQQGDANGVIENGFGSTQKMPQGRMRQRGASARLLALKSYKINFYEGMESWRGQKTLNLNKHYKDETRIKQKFIYDMVPSVGNMIGLRTTFVRLMIKDTVAGDLEFVDYGLFTHVEQPNKSFLRAHGLDENGHLYNALMMEFQMSNDFIESYDGSEESIQAMESLLEVEVGNKDHTKVLEMLEAVNDYNRDFEDVLDQYFNEDNLYTWLAYNILINNVDATSQNFMLYSPSNATTWYIIPWDNDKTFYTDHIIDEERENIRHYGLARFWNMVVFQRLVSNPDRLSQLNSKIEEINTIFQRQETEELLEDYGSIAVNQLMSMPEIATYNGDITTLYQDVTFLNDLVSINKDRYYEGLQSPMPFFLGDPLVTEEEITLNWSNADDLQGDIVTYEVQIAEDSDFSNILIDKDVGINTDVTIEKLTSGVYYYRVIAYDSDGHMQNSFDRYLDENNVTIYGIKVLVIE